ncbi:hypothetical protein CLOLEP_00286 [[Clostridium] leptum DSM 753]|uniref:Lipoprotein n=1 Tax=[Clostridium] leptum DSM 753 TaxID=428125 RepID=A7VP09_9FIRM|nr:hypothetical protein CLOLEP_00286 [[Clostridium] leptum DSM 753]
MTRQPEKKDKPESIPLSGLSASCMVQRQSLRFCRKAKPL